MAAGNGSTLCMRCARGFGSKELSRDGQPWQNINRPWHLSPILEQECIENIDQLSALFLTALGAQDCGLA